ncbi:hypothetical protein ASG14_14010 [Pedobacter sp. Leaf194]|nr:hypothetical protein ASG14_14010 [Pedobacter sp. Leaf194]
MHSELFFIFTSSYEYFHAVYKGILRKVSLTKICDFFPVAGIMTKCTCSQFSMALRKFFPYIRKYFDDVGL